MGKYLDSDGLRRVWAAIAVRFASAVPVDMGLPSGTKWAACDLGAASPFQLGWELRWGRTHADLYSDMDGKGYGTGSWTLSPRDDAASAALGGAWMVPTDQQFLELVDNCDASVTTAPDGGKTFRLKSSKNEQCLYFPYRAGAFWWTADCQDESSSSAYEGAGNEISGTNKAMDDFGYVRAVLPKDPLNNA